MVRKYRTEKHNKKRKQYGFSEWDHCAPCRHTQHYEEFKISPGKKKRTQRPALKRKAKYQKPPTYAAYMQSNEWRAFKVEYWKTHDRKCAACGSSDRMCIHHVHYGYLGREREEDLVPLCWDCHVELHEEYGTETVMVAQTNDFIAAKQMQLIAATL